MEASRPLRLVDQDTGEVHDQLPDSDRVAELEARVGRLLTERDALTEAVGRERAAAQRALKLMAEAQGEEPDADRIKGVLLFYRNLSGRSRIDVDPGTDRWMHTRARLRKKQMTPERLKAALVGARKAPYFRDAEYRQDPKFLFEKVERIEDCETGAERPEREKRAVSNLTPLQGMAIALQREYGLDVVEVDDYGDVWGPCPLHPGGLVPVRSLRLREHDHGGAVEATCANGCDPDDVIDALRGLYGLQAGRDDGEEIAGLRVRSRELEHALQTLWRHGHRLSKDARHRIAEDALFPEGLPGA